MGLQLVQDEASMPIGTLSVWETASLTFYFEKKNSYFFPDALTKKYLG
jgi:hypothetical protein